MFSSAKSIYKQIIPNKCSFGNFIYLILGTFSIISSSASKAIKLARNRVIGSTLKKLTDDIIKMVSFFIKNIIFRSKNLKHIEHEA